MLPPLEGPVFERELNKAYIDGVGHYSRPDLSALNIRDEAWTPSVPSKLTNSALDNGQQLQDLLKRYSLTLIELEEILKSHLRASE